ncbi:heme-binding protein [Sulfurimonas sp. HSL3-7]|uniref:GlcG/HbpS family heme-binding protein n=1 Tax=Sulfonitrofixus jiaomeiensis TaxID=3131938 RepID=UPI0031F97708
MKIIKIAGILLLGASALMAGDVVKIERMSLELATEVAKRSVEACRAQGYWVSAVVVDRSANVQVAMRDTYAPRFTMQIAEQKANAVIMAGTDSAAFVAGRADIRNELNNIDGLIMMGGALAVKSGDVMLGAVGVSGAPGGDLDAACAAKALKSLEERLAFALMGDEE